MTVECLRLVKELKGIEVRELELVTKRKKGMCSSRSFGKPVETIGGLKEAVTNYATLISEKLRNENSAANCLSVFVHTNVHKTELPQYAGSKNILLPVPTNSTREIVHYSLKALELIFKPGYKYVKAGVMVTDIIPADQMQTNIFDEFPREKDSKINSVFDILNGRYGRGTLRLGSEGFKKKWRMRQAMLSQHYTTDWNEILKINLK
jgi:DNA polymerase V